MDLGPRLVQRLGDLRQRRLRHMPETRLKSVQDQQKRTLAVEVLLDHGTNLVRRRRWLYGWHGSP